MESACRYCGKHLDPKAYFCPHCGTPQRGDVPLPRQAAALAGKRRIGSGSWEELRRLLVFYALMMACSLLLGLTYKIFSSPWTEVGYDFLWVGLIVVFLALEWNRIKRVFWFHRTKPKVFLQLLMACLAAFVFVKAYFAVFSLFHWPMVGVTKSFVKAHWPLWSVFVMNSVEPGITEEIAFRGILQTRLSQILSRREALIIQAALFSILHLSPMIFVSHFVMGLLLGWVRLRTRHVYFGMLLHMAWNAMVVLQELT